MKDVGEDVQEKERKEAERRGQRGRGTRLHS